MAEQHEEGGLIRTPKQLVIAVIVGLAVPVGLAVMLSQLVTSGQSGKDAPEEAVLKRIAPVAKLELAEGAAAPAAATAAPAAPAPAGAAPAPALVAAAPAPAAAAPAAPAPAAAAPAAAAPAAAAPAAAAPAAAAPAASAAAGKKIYDTSCVACHAAGVAGAPKFGDKAAWAPRIKTGMDALVNSVLKGKGAMPPKGGNASIPDADIRAAVEYMTSAAK